MIEQETNSKLEHEKFQLDNREKSPHEDVQTLEQRPIKVVESLSLEILLGTWQGNLKTGPALRTTQPPKAPSSLCDSMNGQDFRGWDPSIGQGLQEPFKYPTIY